MLIFPLGDNWRATFSLKAYKQLPALRVALVAHYEKETNNRALVQTAKAA